MLLFVILIVVLFESTKGNVVMTDSSGSRVENFINPVEVLCKTDESWVWNSSSTPYNAPAASGGGGCFTGVTLVTMADGSMKRIDTIVCDEFVMSGLSGLSVKVLAIDKVLGDFPLFGMNNQAPFATLSHCFLAASGKRTALNTEEAIQHKRWDSADIETIEEGSLIKTYNEETKEISTTCVKGITTGGFANTVYNLTTSDHTFVANGFSVSDDFPEIEKHPELSIRIVCMLEMVKEDELGLSYDEIFSKYYDACMSLKGQEIDTSSLKQKFAEFLELCKKDPRYIRLGDKLWTYKFDSLSGLSGLSGLPCPSESVLEVCV